MKPLLEIKDAVKTIYNDDDNLNILNNINLTINPKDFLVSSEQMVLVNQHYWTLLPELTN